MTKENCKLRSTDKRPETWRKWFSGASGSQLVEFALALPVLVVLAVGIFDFAKAYNINHILTNAAREAARITSANPLSDSSCPTGTNPPCSITAANDDVENYLVNAGLSAASCLKTATPSTSSNTYTYSCNNVSLVINRAAQVSGGADSAVIPATQVTLSYPYTFTFGTIVGLLASGASGIKGQQTLSATAVMQDLVMN